MSISRRHFFLSSLALPPLIAADKKPDTRPNVVLILVDELPSWMLGCYGSADVRTPQIDRLAQTGVRLLHHFAGAPEAKLSRACLLTGRTSLQLKGNASLGASEATLARVLSDAGYNCEDAGAGDADAVATAALRLIGAQTAEKRFFLTVHFTDLVAPYEWVEQKYQAMYAAAKFESSFPSPRPAANATRGKEMLSDLPGSLRKAAAAITALDDRVGALIAGLTQRQLLDNTLVVFTSTCGSLYGRHGLWASGTGSDPVNMYEEAVSTPMIWRWPVRLPPQTARPEGFGACDFLPSVCELTETPAPKRELSGRSYLPLLMGRRLPRKSEWRNVVFSHLENTDMVRDSRYKLVLRDGGKGPNELYDQQVDPREDANGYEDDRFNSIRPALEAEIAKWKKAYSA